MTLYRNLRESYPLTCYKCGHEQQARPSLFMETFQMNMGSGSCLKCGVRFFIQINETNDAMITYSMDNMGKRSSKLPDACFTTKDRVGTFL